MFKRTVLIVLALMVLTVFAYADMTDKATLGGQDSSGNYSWRVTSNDDLVPGTTAVNDLGDSTHIVGTVYSTNVASTSGTFTGLTATTAAITTATVTNGTFTGISTGTISASGNAAMATGTFTGVNATTLALSGNLGGTTGTFTTLNTTTVNNSGNAAMATGTFTGLQANTLTANTSLNVGTLGGLKQDSIPVRFTTVLTPSTLVAINASLGNLFTLACTTGLGIGGTGVGLTISGGESGEQITLLVSNVGTNFVLTFGTNFVSSGTMMCGTAGKISSIEFNNGSSGALAGTYYEVGRINQI